MRLLVQVLENFPLTGRLIQALIQPINHGETEIER
jgi:hypothetical protein